MRRVLVIFLTLLFPLNVLALSLSVSTAGTSAATLQAAPSAQAEAAFGAASEIQGNADIDPDEPPAGMDLHDIVNIEAGLRMAALQDAAAAPHEAGPPRHAIRPPLRPPRAA